MKTRSKCRLGAGASLRAKWAGVAVPVVEAPIVLVVDMARVAVNNGYGLTSLLAALFTRSALKHEGAWKLGNRSLTGRGKGVIFCRCGWETACCPAILVEEREKLADNLTARSQRAGKNRKEDSDTGAQRSTSEAGCLHESLYDNAEETEFRLEKGMQGALDQHDGGHFLYTGHRS